MFVLKLLNKETRKSGNLSHVKGIRIPESPKFLLVKSGILGFGIQGTAQKNWNWESSASDKQLGIHSWNLESIA